MFNKILIANRGEIACRVIRTAKSLGVLTVAIYSEADANSLHVSLADEAIEIGPAPAKQSYLVIDTIINAALDTGAEAIHPGYGFLSENAGFAKACEINNIVFIGPPVAAIEAMGSKTRAKQIMEKAGVPLVPGYHGDEQSAKTLKSEAKKIGYPVLIKASAGGGGKGMRIVETAKDFDNGLKAAKREAMSSFADDNVLIEKYLTQPRHIEIQIFCDNNNNAVHLFERDCSVQRRHQKVVEEAPAPGMDSQGREEMGKAAIAAAQAIDYVGAGTVEFIVDNDNTFYFMEMNTRLQVEHPVSEMISGQDLVEWQLRIASGEELPCSQDELSIKGHALEARIYAEDPNQDFLPTTGLLSHLRFAEASSNVRIDTGVGEGDSVSMHYDPMIAKLIVWDEDRSSCLRSMEKALNETEIVGVTTNIEFLSTLVSHPAFHAAELDTSFIERHNEELFPEPPEPDEHILVMAALYLLLDRATQTKIRADISIEPNSPWHSNIAWQSNLDGIENLCFLGKDKKHEIIVVYEKQLIVFHINDKKIEASGQLDKNGKLKASIEGKKTQSTVVQSDDILTIFHAGKRYHLSIFTHSSSASDKHDDPGSLLSPMPGKIIEVLVKEGDLVKKGSPLLILEAMKMEHTISAPVDGTVTAIYFCEDEILEEGIELLVVEE
jgi:3-methylcrotonyl-CoA carboxylase alpha subunit